MMKPDEHNEDPEPLSIRPLGTSRKSSSTGALIFAVLVSLCALSIVVDRSQSKVMLSAFSSLSAAVEQHEQDENSITSYLIPNRTASLSTPQQQAMVGTGTLREAPQPPDRTEDDGNVDQKTDMVPDQPKDDHVQNSIDRSELSLEELEALEAKEFEDSTRPWANVTTCAFRLDLLQSGFRNQLMALSTVFMKMQMEYQCDQILYQTIKHKDTYGTNRAIPHSDLYDIVHFNTYYPTVPRLVACDESIHTDYNCTSNGYRDDWQELNPGLKFDQLTKPKPFMEWKRHVWFGQYRRYAKLDTGRRKSDLANCTTQDDGKEICRRNNLDLAILRGAQRPHPKLQRIIDGLLEKQFEGIPKEDRLYMTLHARVEPDMVQHPGKVDEYVSFDGLVLFDGADVILLITLLTYRLFIVPNSLSRQERDQLDQNFSVPGGNLSRASGQGYLYAYQSTIHGKGRKNQ